ncbi:hypothetical protein LGZ99_02440 [Photorhabdus temperata]|uniref:hypothetical protein n=1 Tax=Photorhabdus temperata TaxID=574560 RepID=UPI0005601F4C|nr:hypothetical protein [Photorhabdus temperata]MCT8346104.1 hypothetical protein [Photorhabdus temperata]
MANSLNWPRYQRRRIPDQEYERTAYYGGAESEALMNYGVDISIRVSMGKKERGGAIIALSQP